MITIISNNLNSTICFAVAGIFKYPTANGERVIENGDRDVLVEWGGRWHKDDLTLKPLFGARKNLMTLFTHNFIVTSPLCLG